MLGKIHYPEAPMTHLDMDMCTYFYVTYQQLILLTTMSPL